jgi:betaine-aldehyde dehydrogenase
MLIDGEWVSDTSHSIESINPATGEENYKVCAASPSHVEAAVASAVQAGNRPSWRDLLPHERARLLSRIADYIVERSEMLAGIQMRENGKVWTECLSQAKAASAIFRYFAALCETVGSEIAPARGPYLSMTRYEPYGVVAAITPWNSPMTMEAQKVAPALAAGNTVVLKPSEITPGNALELGKIALEAGLPAGVLNVLPGDGPLTGDALVCHPRVRMISFTGGTATGRTIARAAAERLVPVSLELGGKSPHIVFPDANVHSAVKSVAAGIFEGSGQSCVAGSRLFVHRSLVASFVEQLVQVASALKVDLPDVSGAEMGPLASFRQRTVVEDFVRSAMEEGAEVLVGGARPEAPKLQAGAFYLPTIISNLTNRSQIARKEIFGPVLCVMPFDDEDDLVAQANDTEYGLAAGIWTADYERAWRVASRLEAGTVWINTYKQLSVASPFGGYKESGFTREKGLPGMRLYQQLKSIYWATSSC